MNLKRAIIKRINYIDSRLVTHGEEGLYFYYSSHKDYDHEMYGTDSMRKYGCALFTAANVLSNVLGRDVTPLEMRDYAVEHGFWAAKSGTLHTFVPEIMDKYGLCTTDLDADMAALIDLDRKCGGKGMGIALCVPGTFSYGRHFISFFVNENGIKVLNSDRWKDLKRIYKPEQVEDALSKGNAMGPLWYVYKKEDLN